MKKRIIGIDVARALAVIGMIIVNFKVVLGDKGQPWAEKLAAVFEGKAAATFVVLAGIGLALMTNSAVKNQDKEKLQSGIRRILKRAIFLFVVGLSWIWIWPADILHFYGIYMLVTLLFINQSQRSLLIGALGLVAVYPLILYFFDYETGWILEQYAYPDFWTLQGFFRNLFINGFHPVIPWTAFMLFGLWFGRQDLRDTQFLKRSLWISLAVFIATQIVSSGLIHYFSSPHPAELKEITQIFGTHPMPPMPLYMVNGISISTTVISACILLAARYENNKIIDVLNKTGQLALTFYAAHVILGMGLVEGFTSTPYGEFSIEFSLIYALVFSLLCMLFAEIWLRYKKAGPLEWIMRKLTN
ncbi:MAG: DUF418 domain-containing protein [Bacteroidota bacterium]